MTSFTTSIAGIFVDWGVSTSRLLLLIVFFHMYALRMSIINKEATYLLTYLLTYLFGTDYVLS